MVEQDDFLLDKLRHYGADIAADETLVLVAASLRDGTVPSAAWSRALAEPLAQAVVLSLKDDADRHWRFRWQGIYTRALQIIAIGEARMDLAIQALGTMAKGDAVKLVTGRLQEAWDLLERAGNLYRASHLPEPEKEIGWARTRIGRVYICPEVGQAVLAFAEAEQAQHIFERYEIWYRLISLQVAWARACDILQDYRTSIIHYEAARRVVERLGPAAEGHLSTLYNNIAIALSHLGKTKEARHYYQLAAELSAKRGERGAALLSQLNVGVLWLHSGQYGRALRVFDDIEAELTVAYPREQLSLLRAQLNCYAELHRYEEARTVAYRILGYPNLAASDIARVYQRLAEIEASAGNLKAAREALDRAEAGYSTLGATQWLSLVSLDQARLSLQEGQYATAHHLATRLGQTWHERGERYYEIEALLVQAEADVAQRRPEAQETANLALGLARQDGRTPHRYHAHVLLGRALEADQPQRARQHYRAALAAVTRLQQSASYTQHADLWRPRQEALHRFMRVEIGQGRVENAFYTLEDHKSRLFRAYLQKTDRLRWVHSPQTTPFIERLAELRTRHNTLLKQWEEAGEVPDATVLATLERAIREVTERLYRYGADSDMTFAAPPPLATLQAALPARSAMIIYYDDGQQWWGFVLTREGIRVKPVPLARDAIDHLLQRTNENIHHTVKTYMPDDLGALGQARKARRDFAALGDALLASMVQVASYERLYLVPYGALHTLPFNLLRVNGAYLIEQTEVVTLPFAALLTHRTPSATKGMRWVGYSLGGHLPHAVKEAQRLHTRWGGVLYTDDHATSKALNGSCCQVLHLSTHGIHRVDHHFDLSYVALADSRVCGDDILQMEMGHDLVTLSACEAGAATVAPGEEVMGLGRAFLYAGVGAVVASLWQVREEVTVTLMEQFYAALFAGANKAAALRGTQVGLLEAYPLLHPAYWGAFQLVGNNKTLTGIH